jgi:FMN hydrolase / 5-amino-6-(5-phospho-D-ribitylamino)uracil phosphatase
MIRVVSFDLDQTLWDFRSAMRRALRVCLDHLRVIAPEEARTLTVDRMIKIRDDVATGLRGRETSLERIRLAAFVQTLADIGVARGGLAVELNDLYLSHRFQGDLYDDARPVLGALSPRYTLGVVSNGNSYPRTLGLNGVFSFTVFSQDHGVEKPDARIFELAAAKAGAASEEIVHVGDSLEDDVAGAQAAGWRAILLDREGSCDLADVSPDATISSLNELPALLKEWERAS